MGIASLTARAVFLDRDGVLNRALIGPDGVPRPPADLDGLELEPGVEAACQRLKAAGFLLVVITNQPDVARGTQTRAVVELLNAELRGRLPLDAIQVCYHDDADLCACRKPNSGMLLDAAERFAIDLQRSVMVGDRWRDVEAGRRAGCATVLISDHAGSDQHRPEVAADHRASSLAEAVDWIIRALN